MTEFINSLLARLGGYVPTLVGAVLVLVIGLLLAVGLKHALAALLGKLKIDERVSGKVESDLEIEGLLTSLVYYIAVIYVLLLTLGVLGVEGVLDPLMNMLDGFFGILPNIIAAILLGVVGYMLAKLVAAGVSALSSPLDEFRGKMGLSESFAPSKLIGQLIFVFVFVPILVAALEALKIEAISGPAVAMLDILLAAIPQILAAALVLAVAYVVGRFVTGFVTALLQNLGADDLPAKIGVDPVLGKTTLSRLTGWVLFFFIMLGAAVSAAGKLGFPEISGVLGQLLVFSGNVVLGLIILGVGTWISNLAYDALMRSTEDKAMATIARVAIIGLVLAMGLRAMGIAEDIVNIAFLLSLGAVAVAVALSFGLGGREAAGEQMRLWFEEMRNKRSSESTEGTE